MVKKKVKKTKKVVKAKKVRKVVRKAKVKAKAKEKVLGRIEHFFDKISVAAIAVKAPFKVGDTIRIKGHTTDFTQTIDSIQIEHQWVAKVKKGDDIGIKVKEVVRPHDLVYLAPPQKSTTTTSLPAVKQTYLPKPPLAQTAIFGEEKRLGKIPPAPRPIVESKPAVPPPPKPEVKKSDPYSKTKFLNF